MAYAPSRRSGSRWRNEITESGLKPTVFHVRKVVGRTHPACAWLLQRSRWLKDRGRSSSKSRLPLKVSDVDGRSSAVRARSRQDGSTSPCGPETEPCSSQLAGGSFPGATLSIRSPDGVRQLACKVADVLQRIVRHSLPLSVERREERAMAVPDVQATRYSLLSSLSSRGRIAQDLTRTSAQLLLVARWAAAHSNLAEGSGGGGASARRRTLHESSKARSRPAAPITLHRKQPGAVMDDDSISGWWMPVHVNLNDPRCGNTLQPQSPGSSRRSTICFGAFYMRARCIGESTQEDRCSAAR